MDDLAKEVFRRLTQADDAIGWIDPYGYVESLAVEIQRKWREQGQPIRSPPHADENMTERVSRSTRIRRQLDALPKRQRELLLLHVDTGLTYREIARQKGLHHEVVLRDLACAYSQLRMKLSGEDWFEICQLHPSKVTRES